MFFYQFQCITIVIIIILKIFFLYLFIRERGREEERQRNMDQLPLAHPTGNLVDNPGLCPDQELNQQTDRLRDKAHPTELHQSGQIYCIIIIIIKNVYRHYRDCSNFFYPHPRTCPLILERREGAGRERERPIYAREKQSSATSRMLPDQGPTTQLRHVT